jgi:hypothetical protein
MKFTLELPALVKMVQKVGKKMPGQKRADPALRLYACNPEQVKTFTGTKGFSSFAVVARCHEAQRLTGDDEGFSVKGEFLDAVQLP